MLDCMHVFLLAPDSSFTVALLWSAPARVIFVAGAWLTSGLTDSTRMSTCCSAPAVPTPAHTTERTLDNSQGLKMQGAELLCSNTWRRCHRRMRTRCAVAVLYAPCMRRGLLCGDLFLLLTICFVDVRCGLPLLGTLQTSGFQCSACRRALEAQKNICLICESALFLDTSFSK